MKALRSFALICAAVLAVGCENSTGPRVTAGTYVATATSASNRIGAFTTTEGGVTTDWLAEGATIEITLNENGTTTGNLFIPDASGDIDEDLTGTWDQSGGTLTLSHPADTFLRDMEFQVEDENTIRADRTFQDNGVRIQVTLVRVN